jgi:hypothetical protein
VIGPHPAGADQREAAPQPPHTQEGEVAPEHSPTNPATEPYIVEHVGRRVRTRRCRCQVGVARRRTRCNGTNDLATRRLVLARRRVLVVLRFRRRVAASKIPHRLPAAQVLQWPSARVRILPARFVANASGLQHRVGEDEYGVGRRAISAGVYRFRAPTVVSRPAGKR